MPLEATLLLLDNSEYMLNGDYAPTRFKAQSDAINVVFQTKIDANPENTVGVMTMAGKAPQVLVTGTKSQGHVLSALHQAEQALTGSIDIPTSISIAQLALKHRENKNLRQRIIVFVGSPPNDIASSEDFEKAMTKLGKKLKKNNVAVDIVCYGDGLEEEGDTDEARPSAALRALVESANSADNSHIVAHPPSPHNLLSDALISSPILAGDRAAGIPDQLNPDAAGGASDQAGGNFEFGVDPSLDPELAMALRISMQEAQARETAEAVASGSSSNPDSSSGAAEVETRPAEPTDDDEEALLQQAIALSQADDVDMHEDVDMEDDEEDAIAKAIAMSMDAQEPNDSEKQKEKK